jgi:hypothetical protein
VTRPSCSVLVLVLVMTGLVPTTAAQVVQPPPGSARGIFGGGPTGPDSPGMTLGLDFDGGYDDTSLAGTVEPGDDQYQPFQSGYVTNAAASLRYQRGRAERFLLGLGSGSISHQQVASGEDFFRLFRGEASVQAATGLGGRSGLTVGAGAGYEPTFLFGAFDSLDRNGGVDNPLEVGIPPTADPAISLTAQRWLTSNATAGLYRNLTSRQRVNVNYAGLWVQPISGPGFRSQTHSIAVTHAWAAFAASGFETAYRYNRNAQTLEGTDEQPVDTHSVEGQFRHDRRLSTDRTISFMVGGGVVGLGSRTSDLGTINGRLLPTVSGSVELRFLPTWGVALGARRDVIVLGGLSSEPFESDAATLTVTGTAWRRLTVGATGGLTRGRVSGAGPGDYDQTVLNAQMGYGFGSRVGLVVGYAYNTHELRDVTVAASAFPSQFSRHSARVGLTFWLPLYGSF